MPDALQTMTPQQAQQPEYDERQSVSRASPVIANSSSLLAQTQAVQDRLVKQGDAPGGSADSASDPNLAPPEDPSVPDQPASATDADTVQQVDVQQQKPFAVADGKTQPDANIDLSLSNDSPSNEAEKQAGAAEQVASSSSTSAPELPATADTPKLSEPAQPASAAQPVVDTKEPSNTNLAGRAAQEVLGESASQSASTGNIQHGLAVATTPLQDAAAPSQGTDSDTRSGISRSSSGSSHDRSQQASAAAPVSVQLEDGRRVMTTPLEDAAEPSTASQEDQADAAQSLHEEEEQDQAAATQRMQEEEEEELANIRRVRETEKPPALAALDASILDEPGEYTCCIDVSSLGHEC